MLITGEEAVGNAARQTHSVKLIVVANDVSDNTRKRVEAHARAGNIPLLELPHNRKILGHALGLAHCACAGVTDKKMAQQIQQLLD